MKKMLTAAMLMPTCVSRFACIAGECEDTCCAGWGVTLDRDTFLHYQACPDPVLKPLFDQHVKRYAHSRSTQDHGHIELRGDDCRSCSLLSPERLCRVQERLGERALSDTCNHYPRTFHRLPGYHQASFTLSCPEAARLALLAEDAFSFVEAELTVSQDFVALPRSRAGFPPEAMDEVRMLLFQVLRSPDLPLGQRLKVIGGFCERLTAQPGARARLDLPGLVRSFEADLESGQAVAAAGGTGELLDVQAQIATSIYLQGRDAFQSPHVRAVLAEVDRGLGIREGEAPEAPHLVAAYEEGRRRLDLALAPCPWLLEHALANDFLREVFPWGQDTPMGHYALVVIRFALLRLMLAGRAAAREGLLSPSELAETVQAASRRYGHDRAFSRQSEQSLAEADWASLERLGTLL